MNNKKSTIPSGKSQMCKEAEFLMIRSKLTKSEAWEISEEDAKSKISDLQMSGDFYNWIKI